MLKSGVLHGRNILVTGAAGALGSVAAKAAAAAGATVVLLGRTIPKLERIYDAIVAAGGPEPAIYPLDLSGASEKDYADLATTIERELGSLHGIFHGAAELGFLSPLTEIDAMRWQRLLHINLGAPFLLTREVTGLLARSGGSTIVFVGDSAVATGKAYWGAYGVAKLGLQGYARILAEEVEGSGIAVRFFVPGPFRSPIRLAAYPAEDVAALPAPEALAGPIMSLFGPALDIATPLME